MPTHTTRDGLITVTLPDGGGWQADEDGGSQGPASFTAVKVKRTAPGEFFFMLAKDYAVAPEHVLPAERLVREVYPDQYRKMFPEVKYDLVAPVDVAGVTWWEAAIQMRHDRLGAIAKLERIACVGTHVLTLSFEGRQADVRTHFPAGQAWMDATRFATLGAGGEPAVR